MMTITLAMLRMMIVIHHKSLRCPSQSPREADGKRRIEVCAQSPRQGVQCHHHQRPSYCHRSCPLSSSICTLHMIALHSCSSMRMAWSSSKRPRNPTSTTSSRCRNKESFCAIFNLFYENSIPVNLRRVDKAQSFWEDFLSVIGKISY